MPSFLHLDKVEVRVFSLGLFTPRNLGNVADLHFFLSM